MTTATMSLVTSSSWSVGGSLVVGRNLVPLGDFLLVDWLVVPWLLVGIWSLLVGLDFVWSDLVDVWS